MVYYYIVYYNMDMHVVLKSNFLIFPLQIDWYDKGSDGEFKWIKHSNR